jgi:hypothetical protein
MLRERVYKTWFPNITILLPVHHLLVLFIEIVILKILWEISQISISGILKSFSFWDEREIDKEWDEQLDWGMIYLNCINPV